MNLLIHGVNTKRNFRSITVQLLLNFQRTLEFDNRHLGFLSVRKFYLPVEIILKLFIL